MFFSCALCQARLDPRYDEHVLLPIARAHISCADRSGMSPDELAQLIPCHCGAQAVVRGFGGHLVERNSKVPPDEVWISLAKEQKVHRFRMTEGRGSIRFQPVHPTLWTPGGE